MGTLNGNVRAAIELIISSQDSCQAVFFTLSPTAFGQLSFLLLISLEPLISSNH